MSAYASIIMPGCFCSVLLSRCCIATRQLLLVSFAPYSHSSWLSLSPNHIGLAVVSNALSILLQLHALPPLALDSLTLSIKDTQHITHSCNGFDVSVLVDTHGWVVIPRLILNLEDFPSAPALSGFTTDFCEHNVYG